MKKIKFEKVVVEIKRWSEIIAKTAEHVLATSDKKEVKNDQNKT
jgi:hypothetical protein